MRKYYIAILGVCMLAACKPNLTTQAPKAGSANFTSYLAVGNSLTAGYADGSLYLSGQQNSYPLRLSEQFKQVGGNGVFNQPLLNSDIGYPNPKLILGSHTNCLGTSLSPIAYPGTDIAESASDSANGPFNNLGIPGIRSYDYLVPGYAFYALQGNAPYAYRMYDAPATETPMDYLISTIKRLKPTFFTCWLGNNDVLLYATGGGQGTNPKSLGTFYKPGNITPVDRFATAYDSVVNVLTANGAKGALMNIPDVTTIPFCTTLPIKGLTLSRQGQADSLNAAYGATGASFSVGSNYFIIQDHNGNTRQARAGEYLLLTVPTDSLTCYGMGSQIPIPAQYVLTGDEVDSIQAAVTAYNQIIQAAAAAHGLAYVDMNSYLRTLSTGIVFSGVTFNATFVTGGAFSLDGVHLTPRGYALAANFIIQNINSKYGSTISAIDVNKYSGIKFP